MRLFNPITSVIKKVDELKKLKYYLHAITYTDSSKYRAKDFEIVQNGSIIDVNLVLELNPDVEHLGLMSPVVHVVPLGELPGQGTTINLKVKYSGELMGRGVIDDDHAEEDDKPTPSFALIETS